MPDAKTLYNQAVAAARQKDYAASCSLVKQSLKLDPNSLDAWLLAARVVDKKSDAIYCCKRILLIDPGNVYAKEKLAKLEGEQAAAVPSPAPAGPPSPTPIAIENPVKPPFQGLKPIGSQPASGTVPLVSPFTHPVVSQPPAAAVSPQEAPPPPPAPKNGTSWIILGAILLGVCVLAVLGVAVFSPGTLSPGPAQPTPTSDELFRVLYANARAANGEDIAAYMATIHSKNPLRAKTEDSLKQVFAAYDLDFRFSNLELQRLKKNEAKIHFVLTTKKIRGGDFRNNTVTGVMILRPDEGVWKIYNQQIEGTQYF
jgi:tetratricopeptide (TPR) repeat protein